MKTENNCGGLCGSIKINGFLFDKAVHMSFTNDEKVRHIFNSIPYISHKPEAYNYYKKVYG